MNRWLALLISIVGGAMLGFVIGSAVMVGLYAMLWIFVFGDDSWAHWVKPALDVVYPLFCFVLVFVFARIIWAQLARRRPTS